MARKAAPEPTPEPSMRPSDFIDSQTALIAVLVCMVIICFPVGRSGYAKLAVLAAAYKVAASYGVEDDATATVAMMLGVAAAYRLYQFVLTLLATFPLQLTFPFVVDLIPRFAIEKSNFFNADGATPEVAAKREAALEKLKKGWQSKFKQCLDFGAELKTLISDVRFTSGRCFPPFNKVVNEYLDPSMALAKTNGPNVIDIDGNSAMDISGSYGVNVCGYEAYKGFITEGWAAAKDKGLYLGSLDKTTLENIKMIQEVSGQPEVSFHMSGTEAVMAAVRCARFNQRKPLVVTFGGAYHGWWDGMQPSAGNERTPNDVLQLKDMNALSLKVIASRASEIAAVLVNPLQCFHLNSSPPSDLVLQTNNRKVGPTDGYKEWLQQLRKVTQEAGVLLIFDEVYTGVPAGSMNAFLTWLNTPAATESYVTMHKNIDAFIKTANDTFEKQGFPLKFANWFSVWSMMFTKPGRYHWMFQYYLRDAGVALSWVGTGRCLFSLDWTQKDFDELLKRILAACKEMEAGGWWENPRVDVKRAIGKEFAMAIAKSVVGLA